MTRTGSNEGLRDPNTFDYDSITYVSFLLPTFSFGFARVLRWDGTDVHEGKGVAEDHLRDIKKADIPVKRQLTKKISERASQNLSFLIFRNVET